LLIRQQHGPPRTAADLIHAASLKRSNIDFLMTPDDGELLLPEHKVLPCKKATGKGGFASLQQLIWRKGRE